MSLVGTDKLLAKKTEDRPGTENMFEMIRFGIRLLEKPIEGSSSLVRWGIRFR